MSNTNEEQSSSRLSESLARFLEGEPEPGDEAILVDALMNNPAFAKEFGELLTIDELLRQHVTDSEALVDAVRICITDTEDAEQFVRSLHHKISPVRSFPKRRWLVVSLLLATVVTLPWWLHLQQGADPATALSPDPSAPLFDPDSDSARLADADMASSGPGWAAVLRRAIDVDWAGSEPELAVGEVMAARRIKIESGFIELQMDRGALVRLQGPADLQVVGGMEIICSTGRLEVDVPPSAQGFVVRTPSVTVIDRGTSFAINVGNKTGTEVHVTQGMAELVTPTDEITRELYEGQSVGVTNGVFRDISSRPRGFPSAELMSARQKAAVKQARESWERRRKAIPFDRDCLVYFDFEELKTAGTSLKNLAAGVAGGAAGTIVGCGSVEGRWPGKHAVEFKNAFDRLLVPLPGEYSSLSCIASFRLDAVSAMPASLITVEDSNRRGLEWKIGLGTEKDDLSGLVSGKVDERFVSKAYLRPEQLGTWVHLAMIWDSENRVCRQYINGKLISTESLPPGFSEDMAPRFLSQMVIGNDSGGGARKGTTNGYFSGRIDEFAMFKRALTAQEIRTYQELNTVFWSGDADNGNWKDRDNWTAGIPPAERDNVVIDSVGVLRARYSEGVSPNLSALRIGTARGKSGTLEVSGGELYAHRNSNAYTRVGVAGGKGSVTQTDGTVELNALQLGLDYGSHGDYLLSGGTLIIARGVHGGVGSLDLGPNRGHGRFCISRGTLLTRAGVRLGRAGGHGEFIVEGSAASRIAIGSHLNHDGFWTQYAGSTLRVLIDAHGVTPIFIDNIEGADGAEVVFHAGSLLDVRFLEEPYAGSWDVMHWEGRLDDQGLQFAPDVDRDRWSFEFVDSNQSGTPDTLRVTSTLP